jgi:hypothetical protein
MSAAKQVTTIDQNEATRSEVAESAPALAGIGSTRSEPGATIAPTPAR